MKQQSNGVTIFAHYACVIVNDEQSLVETVR
jgi:hypothetical protein